MLEEREVHLALFHGARRVAADCVGQAPRRKRAALASRPELRVLKRWLQDGPRSGTERGRAHRAHRRRGGSVGVRVGGPLVTAGTERAFADDGHVLDFVNKAFECLDLVGFEHAAELLPAISRS